MAKKGKYIEIEESTLEKINSLYPARGSLTWIVNRLLERFAELRQPNSEELFSEAAAAVIDELLEE